MAQKWKCENKFPATNGLLAYKPLAKRAQGKARKRFSLYAIPFTCIVAVLLMKVIQSVSVFGLGKLGSCIAGTLAMRGFDVLGVDIDSEKVRRVNQGLAPVEEPLLAETIVAGKPRIRATM